jgi:hypothetical protein
MKASINKISWICLCIYNTSWMWNRVALDENPWTGSNTSTHSRMQTPKIKILPKRLISSNHLMSCRHISMNSGTQSAVVNQLYGSSFRCHNRYYSVGYFSEPMHEMFRILVYRCCYTCILKMEDDVSSKGRWTCNHRKNYV